MLIFLKKKKKHSKTNPTLSLQESNLETIENIKKDKKVFVIGMSKTETTSMEVLLESLGYRICKGHWNSKDTNFLCACYYHNDIDEILNITNYYAAFADAPWGGTDIYKELVKIYPKAYYIHTYRDSLKWSNSFINMYLKFDKNIGTAFETMRSFGAYGNYLFFKKVLNINNLENCEEKIKNYFIKYNEEVEQFFSKSDYNYLKIDITQDDNSLKRIANFLGNEKVIKIGLPHVNKGIYKDKRQNEMD